MRFHILLCCTDVFLPLLAFELTISKSMAKSLLLGAGAVRAYHLFYISQNYLKLNRCFDHYCKVECAEL